MSRSLRRRLPGAAIDARARTSSRRAMTLIEVLASLSIFSLIMVGLSSWLGLVADSTRAFEDSNSFVEACRGACRRIGEDLVTGDFRPGDSPPRITIDRTELVIDTRSLAFAEAGGLVRQRYRLDRDTDSFIRETISPLGKISRTTLARDLREVSFELLSDTPEQSGTQSPSHAPTLRLRVRNEDGRTFMWEWPLP